MGLLLHRCASSLTNASGRSIRETHGDLVRRLTSVRYTDVSGPTTGKGECMRIEINVGPGRAPCGEVSADRGVAHPFSGWLQLLAILGELLPSPGAMAQPDHLGGELEARTDPELGQGVRDVRLDGPP